MVFYPVDAEGEEGLALREEYAVGGYPTFIVANAEAETISRTLLLAQRTADSTVAEARAEAARLIADLVDRAHQV